MAQSGSNYGSNGFEIYIRNLISHEIVVEMFDDHATQVTGVLVEKAYNETENMPYLVLNTKNGHRVIMYNHISAIQTPLISFDPLLPKNTTRTTKISSLTMQSAARQL